MEQLNKKPNNQTQAINQSIKHVKVNPHSHHFPFRTGWVSQTVRWCCQCSEVKWRFNLGSGRDKHHLKRTVWNSLEGWGLAKQTPFFQITADIVICSLTPCAFRCSYTSTSSSSFSSFSSSLSSSASHLYEVIKTIWIGSSMTPCMIFTSSSSQKVMLIWLASSWWWAIDCVSGLIG